MTFALGDASIPDGTQGAWLLVTVNGKFTSAKLKRTVTSTLVGEIRALSQAVDVVQWLQVVLRDITVGNVRLQCLLSLLAALVPRDCHFARLTATSHIANAMSCTKY